MPQDIHIPWDWRPSPSAWYEHLGILARQWRPAEVLDLDHNVIVEAILEAVDRQDPWLIHPCVNALTLSDSNMRPQRDFQLAIWTATHTPGSIGSVVVPYSLWTWTSSGGHRNAPGRYELCSLSEVIVGESGPSQVDLDPWCHSQGFPHPQSWAAGPPTTAEDQERLDKQTRLFFRTMTAAEVMIPQCISWITAVTRVAIPLCGNGLAFRSESSEQIPGVVYLDLMGSAQIIEALIHESAHRHLFMAEAQEPLVDPQHDGRYRSPLRSDPRPLRGILLAFHALAHICAAYSEAAATGLINAAICEQERSTLRRQLDEAARELEGGHHGLTDWGKEFVEKTEEVKAYGDSRS